MTVYADVLVITNIIESFVLLQSTASAVRRRASPRRLFFASLAGGALSLLIIADGGSFAGAVVITLIKFAGIALEVLILLPPEGFWEYLRTLLVHLAVRAGCTGVLLIFWQLSRTKRIYARNYTVYLDIPLLHLALGMICAYILLSITEKLLSRARRVSKRYRAVYRSGSYVIDLPAVPDTGNRLTDCFTGLPVVIFCSTDMYLHFQLDDPERGLRHGFRLISCDTLNGSSLIAVTSSGSVSITDEKGICIDLRCCTGITLSRPDGQKALFDPGIL
ncbi:MAG: sigma-E processing peptidase SpoIIGA [Ruminococcus sp.]|nr:sigma-E processing peptidase SpoIIGA [Ruminococcus sp.]